MKFESQLQIVTAAGVPPLTVNQTALVINLNADLLDGQHASYFENRDATALSFSGGTLTITRAAGNLTANLDGRYLPLTGGTVSGNLYLGATLQAGFSRLKVFDYNLNNTPTNGVRIATNIPQTSGVGMYTLIFEGYRYGDSAPEMWAISFYPYNTGSSVVFINYGGSCHGGKFPTSVQLGWVGGFANIFILSDLVYYRRFSIRAVAGGQSEANSHFEGWVVSDSNPTLAGATGVVSVPFTNEFGSAVVKGALSVTGASTLSGSLTVSGVTRINNQLQAGQNTNGTAIIDAYGGYAWFGRDSNSTGIRIDGSGNVHMTGTLNAVGAITQNGNQVLHAGNYSSYALPLTGGTVTGQLSINGSTASDILRLYTTGSTVWKFGVTDASGSYLNITADFGNFTINKSNGNVTTPGAFVSTVATGTAPLSITSTTLVTNLNADYLDGQHGSYYENRDITAVGFSNGTLTLTRAAGNLTSNLDGRYLLLSGGSMTGAITLTNSSVADGIGMLVINGATNTERAIMFQDAGANKWWFGRDNSGTVSTGIGFYNYTASAFDFYITDAGTATFRNTVSASISGNAATATNVAWSGITSKPTTLAGYGITDALSTSGGTITGNLTITGTLSEGGYLAFPERVYTVNLTAGSANSFYPIVINGSPGSDLWHHRFSLEMPGQGGGAAYNMDHLHGEARGQGWSDQTGFYRVFHNCYDNAERSVLGIWRGTQDFYGIVIYVRGGQNYYVRTNSRSVVGYTAATTQVNSTFAIKNSAGADVSGTSVAIGEMLNLINTPQGFHSSYNNYIGGTQVVTNSGTWAISISGTAATATSANALNASNNYQVNSIGVGMAGSGTAGSISLNQLGTRSWSITPSGGNLNIASGDGNGAANFSVALQQGGSQVLHAGNYNSYSPTLTGTGASGTWPISISGQILRTSGVIADIQAPGSGTYNKHQMYANSTEFGIESALATDVSTGTKLPIYLTWRGGYATQGGLKVTGTSTAELGGNAVLHAGNYTSYAPGLGTLNTLTNANYFRSNVGSGVYLGATNSPPLQAFSNDGGAAFMSFHRSGSYAVNFGLDPDNVLRIGGWSASSNRWQLDMSGNQTLAGNLTAVNGIFSGNVGAGTSSPYGRLDLGADTGRKLFIYGQGGNVGYITGLGVDLSGSSALSFFTGIGRFEWVKGVGNYPYSSYTVQMTLDASSNLSITGTVTASGATLTGALSGTSASFSGALSSGGNSVLTVGNYSSYAVDNTKRMKQFFWDNLSASTTQARRFEIARIGIDQVNWNQVGSMEIEVSEDYYDRGLKKKYVVWYGYNTTRSGVVLTEMSGAGTNSFQVTIGTETPVTGNQYYLPVYVDVKYYGIASVRMSTSRQITSNSTPPVGYTYINPSPTPTNIADFTPDSTVNISNAASAWQVGGNVILHAGNYSSYALPITGGTLTGNSGVLRSAANDARFDIRSNTAGAWLDIRSETNGYAAVNLYGGTATTGRWSAGMTGGNSNYRITSGAQGGGTVMLEINSSTNVSNFPNTLQQGGNQVLHAGNYTSYSPSLTGAGASGTWGISITGSSASCTGNAATATLATKASTLSQSGGTGAAMTFFWSGQGGQPTWLWGGNDGVNHYVYNPANFDVRTATRMGVYDGTTYFAGANSVGSSGGRGTNLAPNTYQKQISFEFKNTAFTSMTSTYGGLITIAPWEGTTSSTGDPNYQLLINAAAANSTSAPTLRIRAGIDTTWGSWATIIHDANFATAIPNSGVSAGTYNNVTVNAKGLVTGGSNVGYLTSNQSISLTGAITGSGTTSISTAIANSAVTYAKIQNVAASTVLGNPSASVSQAPQEIALSSLGSYIAGVARCWVTFNENPTTGAITINASSGISSVTRINYGQYRVNFSSAFSDANYAVSGTIGYESNGGYLYGGFLNIPRVATPKTTTYCEVTASYGDGNTYNARFVHVIFDR